MRFDNRLRPFDSQAGLRVKVWKVEEVHFRDDDTTYPHFGFKENSKQARFFTAPAKSGAVGLLYEPGEGAPVSLDDPRVVCRLFGTLDRDRSLVLWHISVNASNPLNDSGGGTRWGIHGLVSHTVSGRTRWTTLEGINLTPSTARAHVRGTPNPYAVECLVRCVEQLGCPSVRQHDDMPCTKLFVGQNEQRTHPSIMLLYESLKFVRSPGLPQYAWHRKFMPSLIYSYQRASQQMSFGLPVV